MGFFSENRHLLPRLRGWKPGTSTSALSLSPAQAANYRAVEILTSTVFLMAPFSSDSIVTESPKAFTLSHQDTWPSSSGHGFGVWPHHLHQSYVISQSQFPVSGENNGTQDRAAVKFKGDNANKTLKIGPGT